MTNDHRMGKHDLITIDTRASNWTGLRTGFCGCAAFTSTGCATRWRSNQVNKIETKIANRDGNWPAGRIQEDWEVNLALWDDQSEFHQFLLLVDWDHVRFAAQMQQSILALAVKSKRARWNVRRFTKTSWNAMERETEPNTSHSNRWQRWTLWTITTFLRKRRDSRKKSRTTKSSNARIDWSTSIRSWKVRLWSEKLNSTSSQMDSPSVWEIDQQLSEEKKLQSSGMSNLCFRMPITSLCRELSMKTWRCMKYWRRCWMTKPMKREKSSSAFTEQIQANSESCSRLKASRSATTDSTS